METEADAFMEDISGLDMSGNEPWKGFKAKAEVDKEAAPSTPTTRIPAPGSPFTGTASEAPSLGMSDSAVSAETDWLKTVKLLMGNCKAALQLHGSPSRYLSQVLNEKRDAQEFLNWLWSSFPEKPDLLYNYEGTLPSIHSETEMGESLPLRLHISTLGFEAACSVKPPCGPDLAMELVEQFLKGGFVTADNPLLCSQPEGIFVCQHDLTRPWDENLVAGKSLKPFSLSYAKRVCQVQHPLNAFTQNHGGQGGPADISRADRHSRPNLCSCGSELLKDWWSIIQHEDFCKTFVAQGQQPCPMRVHSQEPHGGWWSDRNWNIYKKMECNDHPKLHDFGSQDDVLETALWSHHQGRTISEPSYDDGLSFFFFITNNWSMIQVQIWNFSFCYSRSLWPQQFQIFQETLDLILAHVQECGWEKSVWSDENLSTKKLYPGFQFNAKGQQWTQRLRSEAKHIFLTHSSS